MQNSPFYQVEKSRKSLVPLLRRGGMSANKSAIVKSMPKTHLSGLEENCACWFHCLLDYLQATK